MEIGQQVRVCRIRDRVDPVIAGKLGQVGIITGFKMTDGSGVGVVVSFGPESATWFFEDEIEVIA